MNTGDTQKLQAILHECAVHARRIEHARQTCAPLFPLIVGHLREDAESLTIWDKLTQLERARAISDAEKWQEFREIRIQLAQDYENDAETAAGYLNDLYESSSALLAYHAQATQFTRDRILHEDSG